MVYLHLACVSASVIERCRRRFIARSSLPFSSFQSPTSTVYLYLAQVLASVIWRCFLFLVRFCTLSNFAQSILAWVTPTFTVLRGLFFHGLTSSCDLRFFSGTSTCHSRACRAPHVHLLFMSSQPAASLPCRLHASANLPLTSHPIYPFLMLSSTIFFQHFSSSRHFSFSDFSTETLSIDISLRLNTLQTHTLALRSYTNPLTSLRRFRRRRSPLVYDMILFIS